MKGDKTQVRSDTVRAGSGFTHVTEVVPRPEKEESVAPEGKAAAAGVLGGNQSTGSISRLTSSYTLHVTAAGAGWPISPT